MAGSDTSLTLLESLRDSADDSAWHRFDQRYRLLLIRFAQHAGLNFHEAEEAAQRTVVAFCETYRDGKYDRAKGRFKHWLLGIAHHKILDLRAELNKRPTPIGTPDGVSGILPYGNGNSPLSDLWDEQWEAFVMRECVEQAKGRFTARDITIFQRLTLQQHSAEKVSGEFDLSRDAVRQIRHRVLGYMRSVKDELENGW